MRKAPFITNQYYHVYNRGVDKREVFMDTRDYRRFVTAMGEFNDIQPSANFIRRLVKESGGKIEGGSTSLNLPAPSLRSLKGRAIKSPRKKALVEIVSYCLMPNHYHFLLRQCMDDGITWFMQKLGTGYTMYFNERYERSGALFQGRFKAVLVEKESYLHYLQQYIHLNPLDIVEPKWKEKGVRSPQKALAFLNQYQWVDCHDYSGYGAFLEEHENKNVFADICHLVIE